MVRLHGNTYNCTIHPRSPIGLLVGVELVLYFQTMRRLLAHAGARAKSDVFYAIFSSAMLLISTIWVSVQTIFCGKMWLQDLGSSGLDAFWAENDSSWYMDLGSMSLVVLQFMTDGLMVWYTQGVNCLSSLMVLGLPLLGSVEQLSRYRTTLDSVGSNIWCALFPLTHD